MRNLLRACLIAPVAPGLHAAEPVATTVRLTPAPGMTRAELKHFEVPAGCAGALVLCPGYNADGEAMMRSPVWRELAKRHRLVLVGLSFASAEDDLQPEGRRGYYYVEKGSGRLLLEGVRKIAGKEVPVSLFGFSGGAHFVHRLAYRFPDKVRVWAVSGFGWHDEAPADSNAKPPGIFVCGLDDERLPATRDAFLSARRAKWPVCWYGVPKSGHVIDPGASAWVAGYFDAELSAPGKPGVWAEAGDRGLDGFLVKCRFPNEAVRDSWAGAR